LGELGAVAQSLATDAIRDLRTLNIRMHDAVSRHQRELAKDPANSASKPSEPKRIFGGASASSSVTLSISSSELKLLRVLQTLQSLCVDMSQEESGKKNEGSIVVTDQLVEIFQTMRLDDLWTHLDSCLHVVKVLEGVTTVEEMDEKHDANENDTDDASDDNGPAEKKLQNSVAGLLTRFLPIIEAFFVVNASARRSSTPAKEDTPISAKTDDKDGVVSSPVQPHRGAASTDDAELDVLIGGKRIVEFVTSNRVLLNALIRNSPGLLEKGLRVMVQVPRCRALLDFDVKRHWFKTQMRRLRQHASRRHGSLRLNIRRKFVFEDAYHQLRLRNADEMRGRLHITFRNEEGVDAGGLSREFFGILAKEIFNPNYALFTSTEDGCTFQPNQNSSINPDHLSYFRFVGRIVGKAVSDGFLLDAHFTRSLYKHMLGLKVNLMFVNRNACQYTS
jgi:E3 ubiquitin-protein ligase HUWE1